jgi:hypothetical protein
MKHKIITIAVIASLLIVGCARAPEPPSPNLAIMVESNIIEAGSSFMVIGLSLEPHQKIWIEGDYNNISYSLCCFEEEGLIYPTIEVPEDVVPGDYEVEIYIGKHLDDRELIATLPIHVISKEK